MEVDSPFDYDEPFFAAVPAIQTGSGPDNLKQCEQYAVIESIQNIVRGQPVPASHQQHVRHERDGCDGQPAFPQSGTHKRHRDPREHVIPQPVGQRDVPAVPKVVDIAADKRAVKVIRNFYSEEISGAHRHQTVSCEIEEQVEAVGVVVNQHAGHVPLHAVLFHQEIQHSGDHGFVHHAQQDFVQPCSS